MVITGSIPELKWTKMFEELGILEQRHPNLLHDTVVTSIKALTEYLGVRRALAPHSTENVSENAQVETTGTGGPARRADRTEHHKKGDERRDTSKGWIRGRRDKPTSPGVISPPLLPPSDKVGFDQPETADPPT
eukprot:338825-Rhodomonas_salina.1